MSATDTAVDAAPARSFVGRLRSIFGGSVGNLVEWYDWYAYSAFALYFAKAFFPQGDQTAQLLQAAGIFAVGFVMRPIGAWLMGVYADRRGRKAALTLSMLMMCAGSLLIALTPSHARIGAAAPAILLIARLIQGLSLGGEYGASATYLSEMASRRHRGFWSSWQYVTLIMGQLAALAVLIVLQRTMTQADLEAWGWRIPFAIGGALALTGLWLRRNIAETAAFEKVQAAGTKGGLAALLAHPREAAIVVGLTMGGTLAFYAFTTYMQKFLTNTAGFSKSAATEISAASLIVYMLLQPLVGLLSDKIGRRPVLTAFGVLGTLCTVPILTALSHTRDPLVAFALITAALAIVSGYTAINAVVKAELFPAHVRALGVALPYALANSLFGGTAEYVALWFKQAGREPYFYWYVAGGVAVSLVVYALMRDTRDHSRIIED